MQFANQVFSMFFLKFPSSFTACCMIDSCVLCVIKWMYTFCDGYKISAKSSTTKAN